MANEDNILNMLSSIQKDISAMKFDIEMLKSSDHFKTDKKTFSNETLSKKERIKRQIDAVERLSNLLNDEEKKAFGKFMDAEEKRKVAIYS